jgi:4'-phosphopantetheinyl transferase EntD
MNGLLADLLPPEVSCQEAFSDDLPVQLFPAEQSCIAGSVDKRRREFSTVRACARQALERIGVAPAAILPGLRGAPTWPAGVVGSMTHCKGYRAGAVALREQVRSIGVDAEPSGPLPEGVLEAVALEPELAMISRLNSSAPGVAWDRLLFSAKEAVYKTWFPLTETWLDFSEARIEFASGQQTFTAELLVPGPVLDGERLRGFRGRWLDRQGLVITAIAVPAS